MLAGILESGAQNSPGGTESEYSGGYRKFLPGNMTEILLEFGMGEKSMVNLVRRIGPFHAAV